MMLSSRLLRFAIVVVSAHAALAVADQSITLDPTTAKRVFEGVGAVSGGGATSVLLKDYPQQQRDQVLDLLFKPNFAASMQTLYVEIGGDGNSTQGTESTHMRSRTDENYSRGYEWWLMTEAKKRNPALTLDACAWGCPGWIGDGNFWSQDMADYDVKWVKGLKANYNLDLDAIGCRNERGVVTFWPKLLRATLDRNGLKHVRIHAFDNPGNARMWDWLKEFETDKDLAASIDILGNHTLTLQPPSPKVEELSERLSKPIWNTEEHAYNGEGREYTDEYETALGVVHLFNDNFISHAATKIVNWYLVGSTYGIEPYGDQPSAMIARTPWSGYYRVKAELWSYAHYGQFTKVGWKYISSACTTLTDGGTIVAMKSDAGDYSVIAETAGAKGPQTVTFNTAGLSSHALCVWRTTRESQFEKHADIEPIDGKFTVALEPNAIYSISTTTGQQKGEFADVPADKPFPMPFKEDFEGYGDGKAFGYLPAFMADICGVFEIADRPDYKGHCLRQVVSQKAQSWAPEWMPYTILGDPTWKDYQVTTSVYFDNGGWAGVMGRVSNTGNGWDGNPNAYYARLYPDGGCAIYVAGSQFKGAREKQLAIGAVKPWKWNLWHDVTLQFQGSKITLLVDSKSVLNVDDNTYDRGLAGLVTGGEGTGRNTALFDDLTIKPVNVDQDVIVHGEHSAMYAK